MEDKKVCHQCRGRSENFMRCKNLKKQKQCKLKFCKRCLLNRYGLKIEEVGLLDDWKCPKCRDKCNCSVCLTKKGYKPTGKLIRATRSEGYGSVSQMLDIKGDEILKSVAPIDDDDDDDITIAALLNNKETSSNEEEKRKLSPEGFRKEKKTKKNESPSSEKGKEKILTKVSKKEKKTKKKDSSILAKGKAHWTSKFTSLMSFGQNNE